MTETITATSDAGIGEPAGVEQQTEPSRQTLSEDDVFHVLQNERRRRVIEYLDGRDEQVRMRDVAEQVAAWEHDTTVQQLSSKERQRVYIPLYQNHLPKLDEKGLIDYDQSRGTVQPNPLLDHFATYLDVDPHGRAPEGDTDGDVDDPWPMRYLVVSGLGLGLIAARMLGVFSASTLSDLLLGVGILAAFVLLTLVQVSSVHVSALK